jgi:tetratricopeptide (TPR) repeat protein
MRTLTFILLLCFAGNFAFAADASTYQEAVTAYNSEDYGTAQTLWLEVSETQDSPALFYNLGNTFYRLNDFVSAILFYERARKLAPGDEAILHNIGLTNSKLADKAKKESPSDLEVIWFDFVYSEAPGTWMFASILAMLLTCALLSAYLFLNKPVQKRLTFFAGILLIPITGAICFLSYSQDRSSNVVDSAIVTSLNVYVKSAPSETGTDVLILNAGTKVKLLDQSSEGWTEVKAPNGETGWLPQEHLTEI